MPDTVLLTATSDGIAYHLAHRLCAQGHPAVLVTPVDGELDWIAAELVLRGADVRAIACDLEKPEGPQALFDELAADGVFIDMLVNNAGHARRASSDLPIRQYLSNPFLDVETALRMTALFLPDMLVRGHGHILNVSSAVGSARPSASPGLASETFLLAWTEALAKELAGSPVTVAAFVNPACGRDALAGTGVAALHDEHSPDQLTPRALADAAYDALLADHPHIAAGAAAAGMAQPHPSLAQHHVRPRRFAPIAQRSLG
jgi:short-subunit dehydrogenase